MSTVRRCWAAFAAVGAGLIHLALVVNAALPAGITLAIIGIAEFGWGVLVLFDGRFLVARLAVGAALIPGGLWIVALLLGGPSMQAVPLAAATVLDFVMAGVLAVSLRRPQSSSESRARMVAGVLLGAVLVAGITVPALVATRAGQSVLDPRFTDDQHH